MKTLKFTSVIWKEDVGYVSKCPELGVASAGDTIEEAHSNLKEAIELYLENAEALGIIKEIEMEFRENERYIAPLEVAI